MGDDLDSADRREIVYQFREKAAENRLQRRILLWLGVGGIGTAIAAWFKEIADWVSNLSR